MTQFQFPPRSTRGAVMGFTWSQIVTVASGVISAVVAANLITAGRPWAGGGVLLAAVLLITLGLLRLRGRRITEWIPVVLGALVQRAGRQDRYRGQVFAPNSVAEHLDLPGPAAGYRWLPAVAADGTTEVGLLLHRRERTVTAALSCTGANFILADTSVQAQRLVDWAQVLNILGTEYGDTGLVRWALTTRAVPDTGNRAQRYLTDRAVDTGSLAYASLAELTAAAAPSAQRHETYLSVVFDVARLSAEIADAGGTDAAVAAVVLDRLAGIEATVTEAGVTTSGWLTPRGYAAVIRTQFDPADQESVDLRGGTGAPSGVAPRLAGPAAAETVGWSTYRHDSGVSRTLWVADMPRQLVAATWLTPLYTRATGRRTVTLLAQPIPAALANLAARREQVARAGDEVTKRRLRLVRTAREDAEARSVAQIDREQAHGHTRYRYALLVTVTADTVEALDRDVRAVKRVLSRAGCEATTLFGEQDQAFVAAALPLARGLAPIRGWWSA
ncbi:SCO6880 family protein [Dactylosporangium sp. NPDC051485]|uniref:SCO6880 family protein n=1 Tax=Dactylosporangium sp. NPDC051485 TaxID=3154846 RepID=UPI003435DAAE